jgi:transposase-like protein
MTLRDWRTFKSHKINPECLFCNSLTKPAIILRNNAYIVRGWRCPKCHFTLIHPHEIPKALDILKEITETI